MEAEMLLANRRLALIYFCLAAMEVTWFTPYLLLFYWGTPGLSTWAVYVALLAALLTWMASLDFLSRRQVTSPRFELAVLGLVVLSSGGLVRALLYPRLLPADMSWFGRSLAALSDFHTGLRPEWALILVNFFLWQRAASASSRDVGFFSVGVSFRLDMLLLILGAALFGHFRGQDARPFLWLYFGLGLFAVSVARVHEGANGARSSGTPLPWIRLLQLALTVGLTVALAAGLSSVFTTGAIKGFLGWLAPLWRVLGFLLVRLLVAVFLVLVPVLVWLQERVRGLDLRRLADALTALRQALEPLQQADVSKGPVLPVWAGMVLRDLGILLVILLALGFVWLYLEKIRGQHLSDQAESEVGEDVTLGGSALQRAARRLRDWLALVRRFGLSPQLLAAVSVQNIYANLCRLARRRGFPRRPAQPPDDYLRLLERAFAGQEAALARITAAYMRVHYGDRPVGADELAGLRADYRQVRAAEEARSGAASETGMSEAAGKDRKIG
jgi:hypothetical protein